MLDGFTDCSVDGATCTAPCIAALNDALGASTSNVSDWRRACHSPNTTTWRCCGRGYLDVVLPATLWVIVVILAVVFSWYTSLRQELRTSVDDLHDIPTQALGVVVARQKKQVLGRKMNDPRRALILLSMAIELGNFSFLPLTLVFFVQNASQVKLSGFYLFVQQSKLAVFTVLLLLDLTLSGHALKNAMKKLFLPLLYDTFFTTYMYVLLDLGACANGMESLPWLNCASEDRFWIMFGVAVVAFTTMFWRTLMYKKHFSDQVFAVQFRFQTSYYSLMTYCRTACCLMFITVQKLYLYFNAYNITLTASVANFCLFMLLLWFNYSHQPCLGVGLVPNNLRSVSFATSCYFSLHLLAMSILNMLHAPRQVDDQDVWIINCFFLGLYPFFGGAVWHINSQRARLFQIPNLSIEDSLAHASDRVRAVGAVAMTLEDQTDWTVEYKLQLIKLLKANLDRPINAECGMVAAYTSRSIWLLWARYFTIDALKAEVSTGPTLPFGLVETPTTRTSCLVSLPSDAMTSRVAVPLTVVAHIQTIIPGCGPTLATLVDSTLRPVIPKHDAIATNDATVTAACQQAIATMSTLARCPFPKARQVVSRTILHMYTNRVVQFTPSTMLYVLCTLAGGADRAIAIDAATALAAHFRTHISRSYATAAKEVADEFNLLHLSQFVQTHVHETKLVDALLGVMVDAISWIEAASDSENPASYVGDGFVSNLWRAQLAKSVQPSTIFLVDDILLNVHFCCENFLRHLRRVNMSSRQRTKRKLSLKRPSVLPAPAASLSSIQMSKFSTLLSQTSIKPAASIRMRAKFSLDKATDFLLETHSSNLIRPVQYQLMKKRRDLKNTVQVNVAAVVQDGFPKRKAVVELSDGSKRALRSILRIMTRAPMFETWLQTLEEGEPLEYLLELVEAVRTQQIPLLHASDSTSMIESMRSTFSMKRSTRESIRGPR